MRKASSHCIKSGGTRFWAPVTATLLLSIHSVSLLAGPLDSARKNELTDMLLQDCGSCHGMTLKGGLGPALTPDALTKKSAVYLHQTILEGHPGTPMPPWKSILSIPDIDYLVSILKSGAALKPVSAK